MIAPDRIIAAMELPHAADDDNDDVRLDKWLWAARFFKTRGLAQEAVKGGKIELNGERPKPSRHVRVGDNIRIRRGQFETIVKVTGLSRQRGPASLAATLYEETQASKAQRQALAEQLRLMAASAPRFAGRPSKRDRRHIIHFTRKRDT